MNNNSRRNFLKLFAQVTGVSIVAGPGLIKSVFAQEKRRGKPEAAGDAKSAGGKDIDLQVVTPGKDLALAMAYHHTQADAEKDPKTDKKADKGVPWDKRFCDNCSFYKGVGKKKIKTADGKETEAEVGTCTIFPKALVAGKGTCNSWAKKA